LVGAIKKQQRFELNLLFLCLLDYFVHLFFALTPNIFLDNFLIFDYHRGWKRSYIVLFHQSRVLFTFPDDNATWVSTLCSAHNRKHFAAMPTPRGMDKDNAVVDVVTRFLEEHEVDDHGK
jgi:hypothetical protein